MSGSTTLCRVTVRDSVIPLIATIISFVPTKSFSLLDGCLTFNFAVNVARSPVLFSLFMHGSVRLQLKPELADPR